MRLTLLVLAVITLTIPVCYAGITAYIPVPTTAADSTCAPTWEPLACDSVQVAVTHDATWVVVGTFASIGLDQVPVSIDTPTPGVYRIQFRGYGANGVWGCWGPGFDWKEPDSSVAPYPTVIIRVEPN